MDIQMTDSEKLDYYQNCMRSLIGKCKAPQFDVVNGYGNDSLDKVSAYISVFRADQCDKVLRYEFTLLVALFHDAVKQFNRRWRETVNEDHPNYVHYRYSLDHAYDTKENPSSAK